MTQPLDPDDSQWLDAVAGKPDAAAGTGINNQGAALRKALQERAQAIEQLVPQADSAQYQKIVARLQRERLRKGRTFSWKALSIFMITAFGIGSALTRMIMLSAVPATRSADSIVSVGKANGYAQTVTIRVEDPTKTIQSAASEAIRLGLAVASDSDAAGQRILISGFVPYSPDQEALRDLLGINNSVSGTLLFLVLKKGAQ